ncbi:precorrin-6y C5,15-methyltransferase (decarboxylating) subunit CbiE [Flavobacterium sp. 7A]|uniref:precorrin-6y C5,15-methyltransferase (decarboxylating) subunit CbiE n=1 Tax=Flavobacterium sp. 7A TaxID=2940571 RepID=UPI002225CDF8|nr:precorrin-6y C5,15-methyltransferase (decarboxylating) subunit CbiE [Flavobacterium sp. 7A]MCW2119676.1 precorrin-6Y C5,15-methyltransferase (decarboxylating) [Flavobacterium sp. 7A]
MKVINKKSNIILIGIGNHPVPEFTVTLKEIIGSHHVFSGGKRHYDLVSPYLPKIHEWIFISGSMEALMDAYIAQTASIVVFASGDPLFYGFGNTIKRLLPKASLTVYPYFNSIQRLCHKTQTNYNTLKTVSVHGRDWSALDTALINKEALIGVLTDGTRNPSAIAKRMLQYGFDNYSITIGVNLDGNDEEIIQTNLKSIIYKEYSPLNCILLERIKVKEKQLGNTDNRFVHLPNRENMITKMPVRLTTIHALNCVENEVFWDIGSCTGAVAIEVKRYEPSLKVIAFEKRDNCQAIIQENKERFSAPGIQVVIADFFELNLQNYPCPDVVFIGGHGDRLEEMLEKLLDLNPNIRLVTNAVQEKTSLVFNSVLKDKGFSIDSLALQVNEHNKIMIHAAVKTK